MNEKLIKFRLDYPLRECLVLAESIREKFELSLCQVVPSDAGSDDTLNGIAVYNLIKLPNTVCNYFRQPLMEMICLVVSTDCLVMSTVCLVVSTDCLVVSTDCLVAM